MNEEKKLLKQIKEMLYTNKHVCAIIKDERGVTFVFEQYEVTIKELP